MRIRVCNFFLLFQYILYTFTSFSSSLSNIVNFYIFYPLFSITFVPVTIFNQAFVKSVSPDKVNMCCCVILSGQNFVRGECGSFAKTDHG